MAQKKIFIRNGEPLVFCLAKDIKARKLLINEIKTHGGLITEDDTQNNIIKLANPDTPHSQNDLVSYTFVRNSVKSERLKPMSTYIIKPKRIRRSDKQSFTLNDDEILIKEMTTPGVVTSQRQTFINLEKRYPQHGWESWKGRYKKLKPQIDEIQRQRRRSRRENVTIESGENDSGITEQVTPKDQISEVISDAVERQHDLSQNGSMSTRDNEVEQRNQDVVQDAPQDNDDHANFRGRDTQEHSTLIDQEPKQEEDDNANIRDNDIQEQIKEVAQQNNSNRIDGVSTGDNLTQDLNPKASIERNDQEKGTQGTLRNKRDQDNAAILRDHEKNHETNRDLEDANIDNANTQRSNLTQITKNVDQGNDDQFMPQSQLPFDYERHPSEVELVNDFNDGFGSQPIEFVDVPDEESEPNVDQMLEILGRGEPMDIYEEPFVIQDDEQTPVVSIIQDNEQTPVVSITQDNEQIPVFCITQDDDVTQSQSQDNHTISGSQPNPIILSAEESHPNEVILQQSRTGTEVTTNVSNDSLMNILPKGLWYKPHWKPKYIEVSACSSYSPETLYRPPNPAYLLARRTRRRRTPIETSTRLPCSSSPSSPQTPQTPQRAVFLDVQIPSRSSVTRVENSFSEANSASRRIKIESNSNSNSNPPIRSDTNDTNKIKDYWNEFSKVAMKVTEKRCDRTSPDFKQELEQTVKQLQGFLVSGGTLDVASDYLEELDRHRQRLWSKKEDQLLLQYGAGDVRVKSIERGKFVKAHQRLEWLKRYNTSRHNINYPDREGNHLS